MTLILHIGAPKTATSTLQNAFFPRHPGVLFLGKEVDGRRGWTGWRTPEIQTLMLCLERTNLEFQPATDLVAKIVEQVRVEAGAKPVVISSEDLCAFSGIDSFKKIERVRGLFGALGAIRLVLAVREQVSLLKSLYVTEHRGEMLKLPDTPQDWYPSFDQYLDIHFRYAWGAVLESYRFDAMIDGYESLVGRENIFVYGFDDFRRDPTGTLRKLCAFMGIDEDDASLAETAGTRENQHYSAREYAFNRAVGSFSGLQSVAAFVPASVKKTLRQWRKAGATFDIEPSPDAVRRITDYYRSDNAALFEKRGIRL
jgi:hypothetical protein